MIIYSKLQYKNKNQLNYNTLVLFNQKQRSAGEIKYLHELSKPKK